MREFKKRIRRAREVYIDVLNRIPAGPVVNNRYEFRLVPEFLTTLFESASIEVDAIFLEGGAQNVWFFNQYVAVAHRRGTAQQVANLSQQSPRYSSGERALTDILRSEPYRRRVSLVAAREFEEMKGLSSQVKTSLSRTLADGIARGKNPREIAREISQQSSIELGRANRIARTEITTALRRARLDEADEATEVYGLVSKEMHISALSPTTRQSHAARHATLHTTDEQRDWWSKDANSINCKCTTVTVLVDDRGTPLVPQIVERARKSKTTMRARGQGPWTKES